ncbi:MAG: 2-succinyl-5-enolpyruvyl-6-hydroxy-3-cyclohexene-1-carboxylic-acid synthase [Candidatus Zixiibacteriota bacterium]|nr:MAG: 2-succinyl-5-enolpyruvyl-6-hydroxy-3-cyclohexene-1-carboxylic-acid synthase [candidate division Zixibacteria bacterium]
MTDGRAYSLNDLWARIIVEHLLTAGIDRFVLSPGSRCTPLTAAVAADNRTRTTMHFDERGAAYFALGCARATGKPAVLICTSGTAAVNYFPAVVEASMDMLPMILLTADRPPEMRGTGANQTINQVRLYGDYARHFVDLPCPDDDTGPESLLDAVDEALRRSTTAPCGPVQINCPFREPLAPLGEKKDFSAYLAGVKERLENKTAAPKHAADTIDAAQKSARQVAAVIDRAEPGLLVIGALHSAGEREAACLLIERLGWPVYADIRSGLRLGRKSDNIIAHFNQLLLSDRIQAMMPSTIIHLGSMVISKRYLQYLRENEIKRYIHVADHPFEHNPENKLTQKIIADINAFCRHLAETLDRLPPSALLDELKPYDRAAGSALKQFLEGLQNLSEPALARLISREIHGGAGLFLGNSMPIRDMDTYADPDCNHVEIAANRGASGIDGSIAGAAGFAEGLGAPVTAVIGDLAFLHDLNSLALLKKTSAPVVLVVINNNGGGIFSFLPVVGCTDIFEPWFGTPHGLGFENIAATFNLAYHHPASMDELSECYRRARQSASPSIIEITTDRGENFDHHRSLEQRMKLAIDSL